MQILAILQYVFSAMTRIFVSKSVLVTYDSFKKEKNCKFAQAIHK